MEKQYKTDSIVEAISITINNLVYEKRARGEDVTVLSLGEAFFEIPLFSFSNLPSPDIYHYTHSRGIPELRQKICDYFYSEYNVKVDSKKEILITAGSKIAVHMAFMALLEPDDQAIIIEPYWVSYSEMVKLCNGVPICFAVNDNLYEIEKCITPRTKCIVLNNPNNPSGKIYSESELMFLLELAKKYGIKIISDEAYSDFTTEEDMFISIGSLDKMFEHSIVCNSISKNYGISGWRLGYLITNEKLTYNILKINQHLVTCPPSILQYYINEYFNEIINITKPQILEVVNFRNRIRDYCLSKGLKTMQGNGTFYLFVSIGDSKLTSLEFSKLLLEKHNVSVVPGSGYGNSCGRYIRLSVGSESEERVRNGVDLIVALVNETVR